jgi:hypothetical protein
MVLPPDTSIPGALFVTVTDGSQLSKTAGLSGWKAAVQIPFGPTVPFTVVFAGQVITGGTPSVV